MLWEYKITSLGTNLMEKLEVKTYLVMQHSFFQNVTREVDV